MSALLTDEAEVGFALITVNVLQSVVSKFVAKFVTIGSGAILAILSNVHEGLTLEVFVLLQQLSRKQLNEKRVRNNKVAFRVRANSENAISAIADLRN